MNTEKTGSSRDLRENSPSSSENEIKFSSSPSSSDDETPIRPIFCLKNKTANMKDFDDVNDCFILDFDPADPVDIVRLSLSKHVVDDDDDVAVLAERGKVACRDYPHARHLCLKFPFNDSPHDSHCKLCFCYVCDSPAPCKFWMESQQGHCHASEHEEEWKFKRKERVEHRI